MTGRRLLRDLGSASLLLLAGSLLGLLWNPSALRPSASPGRVADGRPRRADWLGSVGREAVLAGLRAGEIQVVDARPRALYEAGHIPGALPWWGVPPRTNLKVLLRIVARDRLLVVIDEHEEDYGALLVASRFAEYGQERVALLEGGLEAWREAGLPLARGYDFDPLFYEGEGGR